METRETNSFIEIDTEILASVLMVGGGKMTKELIREINNRYKFITIRPYIISSDNIENEENIINISGKGLKYINSRNKGLLIKRRVSPIEKLIAVDYSSGSSVVDNVRFYSKNNINFILGTTGYYKDKNDPDYKEVINIVNANLNIKAVIAPNMSKEVAIISNMLSQLAKKSPGIFSGYSLEIIESHQSGKKDISGTARKMLEYFQMLGIPFEPGQIKSIRDPFIQKEYLGVNEENLDGHARHTYRIKSPDGSVFLEFRHNVNGRMTYLNGTIDAITVLSKMLDGKIDTGNKNIFDMNDVINYL